MGGSIAVTLIKPDGEVLKMERWTNTLPDFLNHLDFINKKESHITNYLKEWRKMQKDYQKNGPDGPFKYEMTDVYFPYDLFAPSGYGLIVIDMAKDKIYSCQGYCGIDVTHEPKLDPGRIKAWQQLKDCNRISLDQDYGDGFCMYKIDYQPFEVFDFGDDHEGFVKMFEEIKQNYSLTSEELAEWEEFIEDRK